MSVVTVTLLSQAKVVAETEYSLLSVDIRREVNRIPRATLTFLDGDAARQKFDLSNGSYFEPGKEIEIKLRYESETKDVSVFKGRVVRHSIEADSHTSRLLVEVKDVAVALTKSRKSAVYVKKSDDLIIKQIIATAKVTGLLSGKITKTQPKHAHIVQHYCTDWDFIVSRAEAQGLLVVVEEGKLSVRKPDLSASPKHSFKYGIDDIYDLEFCLDAEAQYPNVDSSTWDVKQQKNATPIKAKPFDLNQGNLKGNALAKAIGIAPSRLVNFAALPSEELQPLADGQLMRSRLSMLQGRLSVKGFADLKLLETLKIEKISQRFEGTTLVTGICHRVDKCGWRSDIQFGLSARSFVLEENIQDAPAAGLLPGIHGLHIGVVDKFEEDKEKQFRVKITLPGITALSTDKKGSLWARLAVPDAGKERGWFFYPEPGDEVVVGFFNDDPRQPVILGSLYGSKNTPPKKVPKLSKENKTRAIVSKAGSAIGFMDDKKGSIFIETAGKAKILVDDEKKTMELSDQNGNVFKMGDKTMELSDQNGNVFKMDDSGLSLKTSKAFKLEATGKVDIKGGNITVKGSGVTIEGSQVNIK